MAVQYVGTQSFFICRKKRSTPSYFSARGEHCPRKHGKFDWSNSRWVISDISWCKVASIRCSGTQTWWRMEGWHLYHPIQRESFGMEFRHTRSSVPHSPHGESSVWITTHKACWTRKVVGSEIGTQHGYRRINSRSKLMWNKIPAVKVADPSISCVKIIHPVLQNKI